MDLAKFPLDSQSCRLQVGSFAYSAEDTLYRWSKPKAVSIDKLVQMAQMKIVSYKTFEKEHVGLRRTRNTFRNDSTLTLEVLFERQTGFYLLQIYTPLTLIVFCSWVAFWLIKTEKGGEVPARTALGATSVLSVVNIGFGGKGRPQVIGKSVMDLYNGSRNMKIRQQYSILSFVSILGSLRDCYGQFHHIVFCGSFCSSRRVRVY